MGSTPTMQDIADRCGVSRATVSFALRDDPRITKARREHIHKVAREMGYRPNPLINSLMTQLRGNRRYKTGNLIVLLSFFKGRDVFRRVPFLQQLHDACQRRSMELGYAFDVIEASGINERWQHLDRILAARGTTGVLIPQMPADTHVERLDFSKLAVVKLGYHCPDLKCHRITPYHAQAMRQTLRILKDRGYGRLGFLFHEDSDRHTNSDFLAYAMRHNYESGDKALPLMPVNHDTPPEEVRAYVESFRPDIIVGDHSRVYETLVKAEVRMPEDVEFCCLNTVHTLDRTAGFHQDITQLGEEMVNFLDNLIRQNRRGIPEKPVTINIGGYWIDGPTMRPPASATNTLSGK
jgi:LacI family transcriptional regulator